MCPATEPELPLGKGPVPAQTATTECRPRHPGVGRRHRLVPRRGEQSRDPWLDDDAMRSGATGDRDPDDIHPYAGHGTFVGGHHPLPGAGDRRSRSRASCTNAGAVYESEIAGELNEAMTDRGPIRDLISISAGMLHPQQRRAARLRDPRREPRPRRGRRASGGRRRRQRRTPTGRSTPPRTTGSSAWVRSTRTWRVADFSNFGDWVDVWAHGSNLVNAFPAGTYYVQGARPDAGRARDFTGLAQWSGTSFATPDRHRGDRRLMSETRA